MQKYKCIKEFYVPKYDENDCPTDEYLTIHKDSVYEYTDGYVGESDIRLYLEDGDDDGVGDTNVAGAGAATDDLKEMDSVKSQLPDGYNIIVEAGGAAAWDSTYSSVITAEKKNRFHLDRTSGWTADAEKGEGKFNKANMSDGNTFKDFLEWGLENYPAEKTGVIMWDHGGAMRGCCNDNSIGYKMDDELLNSEVYAACETAFDHKGVSGKLEFIGYDCCLMQVQDVAEFNSHHFNYQVGSEELENGGGWPYDQWLPTLFGGASTETVHRFLWWT